MRAKKTRSLEDLAVVGIDIGKDCFHLVGFDRSGRLVMRKQIKRSPEQRGACCVMAPGSTPDKMRPRRRSDACNGHQGVRRRENSIEPRRCAPRSLTALKVNNDLSATETKVRA